MNIPLNRSMKEILALTKAGRLGEATAKIRQSLGSGGGSGNRETTPDEPPMKEAKRVTRALEGPQTAALTTKRTKTPSAKTGTGVRRTYQGADGTLDYVLFIPANLIEKPPLVVMLHGCTQSAEDFARGTQMNALAEEMGFIVAYPEQVQSANQQKCWNWFRPGDQGRDKGEPAMIAGITREVVAEHGADPARVYVAGLSAGGAAAAIMAAAYPDIFAAAGIHSGLAHRSARNLPSALAAMRGKGAKRTSRAEAFVPVITFHGDSDATVHPDNSVQIHAALAKAPQLFGAQRDEMSGTSAGGRSYRRTALIDKAGRSFSEEWQISGAGHAWSGGSPKGSYTDASGPDASREMLRFFLQHRLPN
ncbi:MAG: PHB depolymerase family esterase [Alteraurantiacibacter sp.]